jgi:flagellar biosynthetic protein FlhB
MPEQSKQDKTEKATVHRRKEAREEGNVARSMDLNSIAVLFSGILALWFVAGSMLARICGFFRYIYLDLPNIHITPAAFPSQVIGTLTIIFPILAPMLLLVMLAGLGINLAQTGFNFSLKSLQPKLEKLSPIKGVKRLFSLRSLVELAKGIIKMAIVGYIGYCVIHKHLESYWQQSVDDIGGNINFIAGLMLEMFLKIGVVLIVLGILDYIYQKWEYEKNLRMTKQEVKEESKQYENPEIKSRIRSIQKRLARRRMMAVVPDATVVVTNPVFIAVALKYDLGDTRSAPVVVAKGKRKIAEKIKSIARENSVPIIENKPLARSLYDNLEIGFEIPEIFYQAVAEILAQVFNMKENAT